jgi:hypothetical protein
MENTNYCGGVLGAQAHDVDVLVTVIAVRRPMPVQIKKASWGRLKGRYR